MVRPLCPYCLKPLDTYFLKTERTKIVTKQYHCINCNKQW